MKTTIRINKNEAKKLYVAARTNKVKLGDVIPFGSDDVMVDVEYKDAADIFAAGRLIDKVSGTEYDAADAKAEAAKAAKQKEIAKAKK